MERACACLFIIASLAIAGCVQPSAGPPPTQAPIAPAKVAEPVKVAEPTKAPAAQPTAIPQPKVQFPVAGKPITIIVPFAAGGSVDTGTRAMAPLLEKELGTPVEVVIKAGASTQIATTDLFNSKPDGYTLGYLTMATTIVTYSDPERKAPYKLKDFQPITMPIKEVIPIATTSDSPHKTLKDLVDAAKAKPEAIKMGVTALMGNTHIVIMALEKASGAKFATVSFDGAAPATTALLGGHVDAASLGSSTVAPHVRSGALRVLGIMEAEESALLPGAKTAKSQGYDVVLTPSYSVFAPAGTPREIVDVLTNAFKKVSENKDLREKLQAVGQTLTYMTPEQLSAHWAQMDGIYRPLIEMALQVKK